MSQRNINRASLDSLLPPGWDIEQDSNLDKLIAGISDNKEASREELKKLEDLRNPYKVSLAQLPDLESELGFMTRTNLTETVRRTRLAGRMFERSGTGSVDNMQNALDAAGFNVKVHVNSPAVDPAVFLDQAFQLCTGDPNNAFAGDPNAYCGRVGGELLVNGPIYNQRPLYLLECGNTGVAYAGDPNAYCGYYLELIRTEIVYEIPALPANWPCVFFVAGNATRNMAGEITDLQRAQVPAEREHEFKTIILKYKPLHTWGALLVDYV